MTKGDFAKLVLDDEAIQPLALMPGWVVLTERLEAKRSNARLKMEVVLDDLTFKARPDDLEKFKQIRIEILGLEQALSIFSEIREAASTWKQGLQERGNSIFEEEPNQSSPLPDSPDQDSLN